MSLEDDNISPPSWLLQLARESAQSREAEILAYAAGALAALACALCAVSAGLRSLLSKERSNDGTACDLRSDDPSWEAGGRGGLADATSEASIQIEVSGRMLSVRGEQVEELRRAASEIDPLGSEPSALPPVVTVDISDGSTSMSHFSLDGVRQLVAALTEDLRAPSSPPLPGLAPLPPRPDEPPPQLPQSLVGARSRSTAMAIRSVTPQPDD